MTVIVGMVQNGNVYIGGDSISSGGNNKNIISGGKVFKRGEFLIGYTSSFRMGQLLQYHLEVSPRPAGLSKDAYMVTHFIPAVRNLLKAEGYASIDSNSEYGGVFMVGYQGALYRVDTDFHIMRYESDMIAIGAGEAYALGALYALPDMPAKTRIAEALRVTGDLCAMVAPPYIVKSLKCK